MVTVPFFFSATPHRTRNPVFLNVEDRFPCPNPFQADIVVSFAPVVHQKLDALGGMESQFFEGGAKGSASLIPAESGEVCRGLRDLRVRVATNAGASQRTVPLLRERRLNTAYPLSPPLGGSTDSLMGMGLRARLLPRLLRVRRHALRRQS